MRARAFFRCTKCVMPNTRPGMTFDAEGVCLPCRRHEAREYTDWTAREREFAAILERHRRTSGPDVVIPVSGGKDSTYQAVKLREYGMHPLLICVSDWFTSTKAGAWNLRNITRYAEELFVHKMNVDTLRAMTRIAFQHECRPTWAIDRAIYTVPIRTAAAFGIPLVVYGEDISWTYGGPNAVESASAREQMRNNVVVPLGAEWWGGHGIPYPSCLRAPTPAEMAMTEPIYLSYFFPWSGMANHARARTAGFKDLPDTREPERNGYIEDYDQIDSIGYWMQPQLKWPRLGHARATDMASNWIREGVISRDRAMDLVRGNDAKLDRAGLDDFAAFCGWEPREVMMMLDGWFAAGQLRMLGGHEVRDPILFTRKGDGDRWDPILEIFSGD